MKQEGTFQFIKCKAHVVPGFQEGVIPAEFIASQSPR